MLTTAPRQTSKHLSFPPSIITIRTTTTAATTTTTTTFTTFTTTFQSAQLRLLKEYASTYESMLTHLQPYPVDLEPFASGLSPHEQVGMLMALAALAANAVCYSASAPQSITRSAAFLPTFYTSTATVTQHRCIPGTIDHLERYASHQGREQQTPMRAGSQDGAAAERVDRGHR